MGWLSRKIRKWTMRKQERELCEFIGLAKTHMQNPGDQAFFLRGVNTMLEKLRDLSGLDREIFNKFKTPESRYKEDARKIYLIISSLHYKIKAYRSAGDVVSIAESAILIFIVHMLRTVVSENLRVYCKEMWDAFELGRQYLREEQELCGTDLSWVCEKPKMFEWPKLEDFTEAAQKIIQLLEERKR